jgi:acyl-CoA synthetase (AMP-forming)/AMP-acid ligase II
MTAWMGSSELPLRLTSFVGCQHELTEMPEETAKAIDADGWLTAAISASCVPTVACASSGATRTCSRSAARTWIQWTTQREVIDFCRGLIASFKIPRRVYFVDQFPLTGSGKIQKYLLRADAERRFVVEASEASRPAPADSLIGRS